VLNVIFAALTAALLALSFPKWDIAFLATAALGPLLLACAREKRPLRRASLGYLAGILYWWGVCYWIQGVLQNHGGIAAWLAWFLFALFCLAKALHMAAFAWLAGPLLRLSWAVLAVPALWVALEFTHGFLGFAWLTLGNAGSQMSVPMRLAPVTGVYGISFAFTMLATALALAALGRPRVQLLWIAVLPAVVLLPPLPPGKSGRHAAILVQPDINESAQWTREFVGEMQDKLVGASLRGAVTWSDAEILVWPEIPGPFYYPEDARFRDDVTNLARIARMHVLLGVVAHTQDGAPLNSALLVAPSGEPVARYDKIKLVPFGEFVPWPFNSIVTNISSEAGDFRAGERVVAPAVGDHRIGTFICYESVFPHLVRRFPQQGAEALFNLSNDGWFGKTAAREQHLKIVRMRAAENRRWILRATNDGITAVIDPAGRIFHTVPQYVQTVSKAHFDYVREMTFYTRYGDWFAALCALAAGTGLAVSRGGLLRRRHP
jgi:apolipoprotein N-acyltransferase